MGNITRIGDVGWLLDALIAEYETGNIQGFMFQVLRKNGETVNGYTSTLKYIEQLGMLESIKKDINDGVAMR